MSFCKYHPLRPATYCCQDCGTSTCDHCSDEGQGFGEVRCFVCSEELTSLGSGNQVEPFWRRFEQAFRYPLSASPLTLVIGLSILTPILQYLPFSLIWQLMCFSAMIKYAFSCLEQTAAGSMTAPDITSAYGAGLQLVFRLLAVFVALAVMVGVVGGVLGSGAATLLGSLVIAALPAVVIIFAMSDSVLEAIHLGKVFRLINAIGLPYGLLLAVIMVMMGSVEFLSQLIGDQHSLVSLTLNSVVSNYYAIVTFHLMGYMLFQYQGKLGYTAREEGDLSPARREFSEWATAKIQVLVKEGEFEDANKVFTTALRQAPSDKALNSQYLEFLLATFDPLNPRHAERLGQFASRHLEWLSKAAPHRIAAGYKRVAQLIPDYKPDSAKLRKLVAEACYRDGDRRSAARLLNGLYKDFPEFEELPEAYELMADILENWRGMEEQARKCRALIRVLVQKREQSEGGASRLREQFSAAQ